MRIKSKLLIVQNVKTELKTQFDSYHNGSAFVFCAGDCPFKPLLMHARKWLTAMLAVKRLVGVAPEMDLRECTLHSPLQKWLEQNPLWIWDPEETSPEI